jgi:Uma2 family endonuclease
MPLHDGPHPDPRGVKLTYDDYVLFPEDRFRHELILTDANVQGVPELIVEIAAPNTRRRDERLYERVGVTE